MTAPAATTDEQAKLVITARCACDEWSCSAEFALDVARGYTFICPECRQSIEIVSTP